MSRASMREIRVGLIVVTGVIGLFVLLGVTAGGPAFLAKKRTIDVVFRDGQGIRVGSPVRVAGIDAGRVTSVDLKEIDGVLRARVRLAVPISLASRLRQDVKVTVQAGLTGQSMVNIVSSGRSAVALVPGQVVYGVESSFFDPVLEQVGLGPVERSHLSHTIAEVRNTVDAAGPRLRHVLTSLQDATSALQETVEAARPKVLDTMGHVEEITAKVDSAKIEESLNRLNALIKQSEALVTEARPKLVATMTSVNALATSLNEASKTTIPKVDTLVDGLNGTRARADRVMANAEVLTGQGAQIVTQNRADIERILGNVRDATDYGVKLVQKLFANPFYLSPFYKPKPEDIRTEQVYDTSLTFYNGAKELSDAVKTLKAMQGRKMTPMEVEGYNRLYQRTMALTQSLESTQQKLSAGLNTPTRR